MALTESEAIVLRTYPLREADLLVTLFTRAEGKVRGVARSAKKSKRRFGGALEPLTYVRAFYDVRERQELARLDACEVLESPLATEVSYARAVALAHMAELLDELLPDHEANDAIFRLTLSVLHVLTGPEVWMPVTYFELWLTRLVGFLPELTECIVCGRSLNGSRAYFHALADGLMCPEDKRLASSEISKRIARLGGADVSCPGGKFCWDAVAQGAGRRSAEVSDPDTAAAYREETGHGGDAGEGWVLKCKRLPSLLRDCSASSCRRTRACLGTACR